MLKKINNKFINVTKDHVNDINIDFISFDGHVKFVKKYKKNGDYITRLMLTKDTAKILKNSLEEILRS